jgi:hypothetical protein
MFYFVLGALVIAFLFWLTERRACKCNKIDNTSEVDNTSKVDDTVLDHVPTKADVEKHNAQVRQQWATNQQKAQQHISSILDKAYKDYVSTKIKENGYIHRQFTLSRGGYGITYDEILAISQPFTYSIYNVDRLYSDVFHEYYIKVTVNN